MISSALSLRNSIPPYSHFTFAIIIGLMGVIFLIDLQLPLGVAGAVPYVVIVLLTLWLPSSSSTWVIAGLCSALTLLGWWWSPLGGEMWKVVANRSLALCAIWTIAVLAIKYKQVVLSSQSDGFAFRSMMDLMPHMVVARDIRGQMLAANQAARTFLGWTQEESQSWRRYSLYPSTTDEYLAREQDKARLSQDFTLSTQTETYRNSQGELRQFKTNSFPFVWPETGETVLATVAEDETDRLEQWEYLKLADQVITNSPDHIAVVGDDYRYRRVNPTYEFANGISQANIQGRHIQELLGEETFVTQVKPLFDQCLQGQDVRYEDWFVFGQQGRRYMAVNYTPLKDDEGCIDGVVVILKDMTDRQLADEGVAYQASLLNAVVDGSSDAIFVKDLNGKYLRINPAGAQMMGLSPDQVLGNNDQELFGKELGMQLVQADQKVIKNDASITVEERLTLHGHQRIFSTMKAPMKNFRENISGVIGVARDITHLKHIQETLMKSEKRFRDLYESAPLAYISSRSDGQIIMVNTRAMDLLGYTKEELLERKILDLYAPTEFGKKKALGIQQKTLAGQEILDEELQMQKADGRLIWVSLTIRLIHDDQGNVLERRGMVQDITQRKEAQDALLQSEYRYRSLIETAGSVIIGLDCDGHITEWNREAENLYGKTREEIFGQNYLSLFLNEKEREAVAVDINKVLAGTPTRDFENPIQAAGGQERVLMWNVDRLLDNNQTPIGLIAIGQDITERRHREKLLRAIQQAEAEFIASDDPWIVFDRLLSAILSLTQSKYGFIGEVLKTLEGQPYLKTHAITNIAWNEETKALYEEKAPNLEFYNLDNLFGQVIKTSEMVIANDPQHDPRSGGRPVGLPDMHAFLGLPIFQGNSMVGMVGVANRPGGYDASLQEFLQPVLTSCGTLIEAYKNEHRRRSVESELRESEQRFELAVWGSNDGLWDWSNIQEDGEWWSPRFYELLGYENQETQASYSQFQSLLHPEDRQLVMEAVHAHLEQDVPFDVEYRLKTKCGKFRWFHARGKKVLDEKGQAVRMAGSIQDIQDRRQGEIALQESEQRLAMALEATSSGSWDWNVETGEVLFGDQWLDALGYTREQIAPHVRSWESLLHPDDMPRVQAALQKHFAGETPSYECINRLQEANGEWRWNLDRGRVVEWTTDGKPFRMVGTDTDISARIHAEQALKDSEARLQAILDNSPGLIFLKDLSGRYLHVNQQFKKVFDVAEEDVIGRTDDEVFPAKQAMQFKVHDHDVIASGKLLEFEEVATYADGPHTSIVHKFPLLNDQGEMFAIGGITTDITARKNVEQALRESEKRFRVIFEQAAVGVAQIVSGTGEFVKINQRYCDIVGYSQEEMQCRTFQEITHPDDLQEDLDNMIRLLNGQVDLFSMEKRYFRKDGMIVWVNLTVSPMWQSGENPSFHIAVVEDITERKQAEEALNQSQKAYEDLVNSVEGIVWECEFPSYEFTYVSQQAERLLGYPIEQWLNAPGFFSSHLHHEDREWALEYCLLKTKTKQAHELEYRMIASDGRVVWLRDLVTVVVENGQPVKVRGVMFDITESKKSEAILKQQALMFQTISEGIILTDREGKISDWNPGAEEMFGYCKDEALGKSPGFLHRTEDAPYITPQIIQKLQVDGAWKGEIAFVRKNGMEGICETTVVPFVGEDGYLLGTIGANHDITVRRQAEARLQQYVDGLEKEISQRTARIQELEQRRMQVEKLAALAQVAAGVAHEINNPLASIGQSLEVLKRAISVSHPRYKYIGKIQDSVDRMAHIVRQLYQLYRPDTASREPVSIHEILHLAIEIMKDAAKRQGVSLVEKVPEDLPSAKVSRNSVTQVLCNIIQNALDVSQQNTIVEIGLEEQADTVVVWVMDHGPGISDEVAPHIFDPFFTTKDGSSLEGGMGLGLAVSYRLIESCGGTIDFLTELGHGTTFRVTIPLEANLG